MENAKQEVLSAILAIVPSAVSNVAMPDNVPAIVPATIAAAVAAAIEASAEISIKRFISSPRANNILMISESDVENGDGVENGEEDTVVVVTDTVVARGVEAAMKAANGPEEQTIPPRCCVGIASKYIMGVTLLISGLFGGLSMETPWSSKDEVFGLRGDIWSMIYFLMSIALGAFYWIKVNFEQVEDKAGMLYYHIKIQNKRIFYKKCIMQYLGGCIIFVIFVLSLVNFIIEGLVKKKPSPSIVFVISVLNMVFTTLWGAYGIISALATSYLFQGKRNGILSLKKLVMSPKVSMRDNWIFELDEEEPLRVQV